MGTELARLGVDIDGAGWSAQALESAPDIVAAVHAGYAAAGATVHTANTFRTHERNVGSRWRWLTRRAVELARGAVPAGHRVAGSIAPLEDCYRPDLSPKNAAPEHAALAAELAASGVDLILCETFPHVGEGLVALECALETGLPAWLAFSPGPDGTLLAPATLATGAEHAWALGAECVLVNCVHVDRASSFVEALAEASDGRSFGVYANGGGSASPATPDEYAGHARMWVERGARVLGGCCYTGPAHIAALEVLLRTRAVGG